jgi:hypothetical protein
MVRQRYPSPHPTRVLRQLDRAEKELAEQMKVQFGQRAVAGLPWNDVVLQFTLSVGEEAADILHAILEKYEERRRRLPELPQPNGLYPPSARNNFLLWLQGMQKGWASLPVKIPCAVLKAWRDWDNPLPSWRCTTCHMVLPHNDADKQFRPCPVCGGEEFFYAALWGEWGEEWINPNARRW